MLRRLDYNAPVALTFAILSFAALALGWLTNGATTTMLFCVYAAPWTDPLTYVRLLGHVLGHANLSHYLGNMMLFLLLGPLVEDYYGSLRLLGMIAGTAVVTGLVEMLVFPHTALLGASGIIFMMIILSSMISGRRGRIPLTCIAVVALYLGQEIYNAVGSVDDISQLAHIIGGVMGLIFGLAMRERR